MIIDGYEFMTDCVTKFFNSIYISGWFHHPHDRLRKVKLIDRYARNYIVEIEIPHGGVHHTLGPNKGFRVQAFRTKNLFTENIELEFRTRGGWKKRVSVLDLAKDRIARYDSVRLKRDFVARVNALPGARLLDIGGRARSKFDRSKDFPDIQCTVFDVLPGENVDVIGDAHELSQHFAPESFNAVQAISVFEHLLMPWKVVVEINKVLKMGGIGLIFTHQTLGMHDAPWDFWRFSDTVWDALFNKSTGFEIEARVIDVEQYILPFIYRQSKANAEKSVGFEASSVVFRKIGDCGLSWDVSVGEILTTTYPDTDDGQTGVPDL
jgi:Methyltransferase domain